MRLLVVVDARWLALDNKNRTEYYNEILENVYIPLEKEWKKINKEYIPKECFNK